MIYEFLSAHRRLLLLITAAVLLLAALALFKTRIVNSALVLIPDSDLALREVSRILSDSPAANILFVQLEGENPGWAASMVEKSVDPALAESIGTSLSAIGPEDLIRAIPLMFTERLQDSFSGIDLEKELASDRKLLGSFGSIAGQEWIRTDPLQFRNVLRGLLPVSHSLLPGAVSADGRRALLLLKPAQGALDASSATTLVDAVRRALPPGYALTMCGAPLHTAANAQSVQKDLFRIIIWSIAGFAAAYILLARSWGAAWILATALAATLCAMGATGISWPQASGMALGFGASLMGLAEDYAVHMHFALRSGADQKRLYRDMLVPLFQSFLLNSSGFAILFFSDVPVIRQMAFFALVSLSTGFALAIFVLPILPGFTRPRNIEYRLRPRADRPSFARSLPLCCALVMLCALLYPRLDFDFSPAALGARGKEIAASAEELRERWQIASGVSIVSNGDTAEEALRNAGAIAAELRRLGASDVVSASDFIFAGEDEEANVRRWRKWLNESNLEDRLLGASRQFGFRPEAFEPFLQALHRPPQALKGPWDLLVFGNSAIVRTRSLPVGFSPEAFNAVAYQPDELEKAVSARFAQMKTLTGAAATGLLLMIWLLLRKWRRIAAILVPPLFSVAAIFSVYVIFGLAFNLASLAALPIVFGLALDHGIMMTHSLDRREALGARRAVALASLTAFFSIGLLALSDHPALRSMGMVIFAGLLGEFVAALWLIPLLYPRMGGHE